MRKPSDKQFEAALNRLSKIPLYDGTMPTVTYRGANQMMQAVFDGELVVRYCLAQRRASTRKRAASHAKAK